MVRKGRDLELLVAHLEDCLKGSDVKIKSPDQIKDKVTGRKREVDVSLKTKVGTHDVLIILECRDQKVTENSTWIEQLATKRKHLGAHKLIAVSSRGFTEGATQKALNENIELRTVEELTLEKIQDWFHVKFLTTRIPSLEITGYLSLRYARKDQKKVDSYLQKLTKGKICEETFLIDEGRKDPISLSDLIIEKHQKEVEQYKDEGTFTFSRTGTIFPKNRLKGFILMINQSKIIIDKIDYSAKVTVTIQKTPIESIRSYKQDDERLADIIRFEHSPLLEPGKSIEIIGIPDGVGRKIRLRVVGNGKSEPLPNNFEKIEIECPFDDDEEFDP